MYPFLVKLRLISEMRNSNGLIVEWWKSVFAVCSLTTSRCSEAKVEILSKSHYNLEPYYQQNYLNLKTLRKSPIKTHHSPTMILQGVNLFSWFTLRVSTVTQTFYRRPPIFLVWNNLLSLLLIIIFIHFYFIRYEFVQCLYFGVFCLLHKIVNIMIK